MKFKLMSILWPLGLLGAISISSCNQLSGGNSEEMETEKEKDTLSITVLQTADLHGQLDPHPELFWENEEIVF